MVSITINGQILHVPSQTPLLKAARKAGIAIPTLCHHEAIKPFGACRLCVVEILRDGRSKLVTSCNYPAQDGLAVFTNSDIVRKTRKTIVELLLARCPRVPAIERLADEGGVQKLRFKRKGNGACILCGLCVRACEEMAGASAISFTNRGIERDVNTPFGAPTSACIGCGSCSYICPTGCIEMVDAPDVPGARRINLGGPSRDPCPNNHDCRHCSRDREFLEDMKALVVRVRMR